MALCAASHGNALLFDLLYLSFFPSIFSSFFLSSLTVTPPFAFSRCLPLDLKLARTTPCQSVSTHHMLPGILLSQLTYSIYCRFWEYRQQTCWRVFTCIVVKRRMNKEVSQPPTGLRFSVTSVTLSYPLIPTSALHTLHVLWQKLFIRKLWLFLVSVHQAVSFPS